jgi:hypothetical protein
VLVNELGNLSLLLQCCQRRLGLCDHGIQCFGNSPRGPGWSFRSG